MTWPVPGGSVTSNYGWRVHPIFGSKKFHHGIDISKGGGTVVAAGSGTVIRASYGWGGGYGNQIFVDHGDGVVTTYNHLADGSFKVSNGATVSGGQAIANVGSTGYSTGPHLHFEVRVNGDSTNPMNYF
jgi:murein DD-endopeptidase MepM/ murein hydrolase activator NlpD